MQKPRQRQTMENFKTFLKDRKLILYGRGKDVPELVKKYETAYIVDRNDELWDTFVEETEVCPPARLYRERTEDVVILVTASRFAFNITRQIQEIDSFDIFYWNVLNNPFLNKISVQLFDHYERIREIEAKLYDDKSREILREVIHRRMIGCISEYEDLKSDREVQYLYPPALKDIPGGIILDCGGYTGDSAERFIRCLGNAVKKIYVFEALPANIEGIEKRKKKLMEPGGWNGVLEIRPYAVSNEKKVIRFWETEKRGGSFSPEFVNETRFNRVKPVNVYDVETCTIDEAVSDRERVGLIKMDIEGAEYEALLGAEKTIKRDRPGLAISIYHNGLDYYRIAELILQFVPEYHLAVRHHKARHVDTVLYAFADVVKRE